MAKSGIILAFISGILFCFAPACFGEMFSSVAEMETMVNNERDLADKLDLYVAAQENRIAVLDRYLERLQMLADDAAEHGISHPAVAFLHIVALSEGLDDLMNFLTTVKDPEIHLESISKFRSTTTFPDETDLKGAVIAIERLQTVYDLDASQFADGTLVEPSNDPDEPPQPTLSMDDCFIIATQLFAAQRYDASYEWHNLIIDRCIVGSRIWAPCSDEKLAFSLAESSFVHYLAGNTTAAVLQAAEAITFDPTCPAAIAYLKHYFKGDPEEEQTGLEEGDYAEGDQPQDSEDLAGQEESEDIEDELPDESLIQTATKYVKEYFMLDTRKSKRPNDEELENSDDLANIDSDPGLTHVTGAYGEFVQENYESVCRGDDSVFSRSPAMDKDLHCKITTNDDSFLTLQPIKTEELDQSPEIKIFRSFASHAEVDYLIPLALRTLKRSGVAHVGNDTDVEARDLATVMHARTAKNAWIDHNYSDVTQRITRRVQAVTGLDLQNGQGEPLQLANYGIGGHYEPHFDFFSYNHSNLLEGYTVNDERLATFMLYLTDVEAGGATVFVRRNLTVWPRKGDALFWYNLHRDGNGNADTLHAGCPVLIGSKWVMNLWIKARGQELTRSCLSAPDTNTSPFLRK